MELSRDDPRYSYDLGEHLNGLYSYAMVLSRNRTEAEDLVQETCLHAITSMRRLRSNSNVKGWLFTILRNVWRGQLRKRRTSPQIIDLAADEAVAASLADTATNPFSDLVSQIEREQVRAAIAQLPVEFREVILLREYEDLSYQEIAQILRCPPGTVMSRLSRARLKLRDLFAAVAEPVDTSASACEALQVQGAAA